MQVEAKVFHRIRDYARHVYSRQQSGRHDNQYVKVVKKKSLCGKFILASGWESDCTIAVKDKGEIKEMY